MYVPTEQDLTWAAGMLALIRDGGHLMMPYTGLSYKIDHKKQTLTLEDPMLLATPTTLIVHLRTKAVFKALYYDTVDGL